MSVSTSDSAGRELYHDVWKHIGKEFLYADRLGDWADWEHRFDHEIEDLDSARRCIDLMLESLGEAYTRRLSQEELTDKEEERQDSDAVMSRRLDRIGYVRIFGFGSETIVDQFETELRKIADCDGFIVDLSGNGGGLINKAVTCCELVVHEGPIAAVEYRKGDGIQRYDTAFIEDTFMRLAKAPEGTETLDYFKRRPCLIAGKPVVVIMEERARLLRGQTYSWKRHRTRHGGIRRRHSLQSDVHPFLRCR
jgi:hypothetical protein